MSLNKYRIWCVTESAYVYAWAEELVTKCPNDTAHTIDGDLTAIVDQRFLNAVQLVDSDGVPQQTVEGITQVSATPGIDPVNMCFCQGSSGIVSTTTPFIEWANTYTSVQLGGISLFVTDTEDFDKLNFEVGMYIDSVWTPITRYGDSIAILGDPFVYEREPGRVSNPIPQGLRLRVNYIFNNPQTANTPKLSVIYHLQRHYA